MHLREIFGNTATVTDFEAVAEDPAEGQHQPHRRSSSVGCSSGDQQQPRRGTGFFSGRLPAADDGAPSDPTPNGIHDKMAKRKTQLGELLATSIAGNDVTGSCLYSIGPVIALAGVWAPISLVMVAVVLYLFRGIYEEVVGAFPANGGSYNGILNTTRKPYALLVGVLSLMSYMATACVSASTAVYYINAVAPVPQLLLVVLLFIFFMLCCIGGLKESAVLATVMFIFHMVTCGVLIVSGFIQVGMNGDATFLANWHAPESMQEVAYKIFFGWSVGMLGITGFETSSNYVEEQKPGVFPKTLRNVWAAATIINPLACLLGLMILPLTSDAVTSNTNNFFTALADASPIPGFKIWMVIDSVLVLCGSTLTAFVGVNGLLERMAIDGLLPEPLLQVNPWFKTRHWIYILFAAICTALVCITNMNMTILNAMYTTAFLSVMSAFAASNLLLKTFRAEVPRKRKVHTLVVCIALASTLTALALQIALSTVIVVYFIIFFAIFCSVILGKFFEVQILQLFLRATRGLASRSEWFRRLVFSKVAKTVESRLEKPVVFFVDREDPGYLNRVCRYVLSNEASRYLKFVRVYDQVEDFPGTLPAAYEHIGMCWPELVIDFVAVQSSNGFNPKVVDCIAREFGLHRGSMLMATWSGGSVKEWPNLRVVIRGDEAPVVNPLAAVTSNKEQTEEITDEDEKR